MPKTSPFEANAIDRFQALTGLRAQTSLQGKADVEVIADDQQRQPLHLAVRRIAAPTRYLIESAIVHAAAEQRLGGRSGILLSVPKFVPKMLDRIEALLSQATVNAAIISDAGGAWIRLPAFKITQQIADQASSVSANEEKGRRFDFSDATAWIIKVVMLSRLKGRPRWWGGYRGPIRTGAELAERAGVSPSMVSHVFDLLRSWSFLRADRSDEICISRPQALLDLWMAHARYRIPRSIPVRPLYSNSVPHAGAMLDWLAHQWRQGKLAGWAVNGWLACNLHETGFVTDLDKRPVSIACLGDHHQLISTWELMRCEERDAMLFIQPTPTPRSIKGGISDLPPGSAVIAQSLPVVDVIQAAIDVAHDPARGFEQAEHICRALVEEISP